MKSSYALRRAWCFLSNHPRKQGPKQREGSSPRTTNANPTDVEGKLSGVKLLEELRSRLYFGVVIEMGEMGEAENCPRHH